MASIDNDGEEFKRFVPDQQKGSITTSNVRSLLEDSDGNIWVGGREGRVNKYIVEEDSFQDLTENKKTGGIYNLHSLGLNRR